MQFTDIIYEKNNGVAKVTINRPKVLNAFRAKTISEIVSAFTDASYDDDIGVVVLTGTGDRAFCTGGDQKTRDEGGYATEDDYFDPEGLHNVIRNIPKPVIAAVNGYAIGGGHVLHVICDLSIASDKAIFGQVGPKVGSFDAGFGTAYLARLVGQKKAREIWYMCEQYNAQQALEMGLVNKVVPHDKLMEEVDIWCQKILDKSPTALKFLKYSFNADVANIEGIQQMAMSALELYYATPEAMEGRNAFVEKRPVDFRKFRGRNRM